MKATTWLCPVLTLLCATRIVCTAQRGGYPMDYADTNLIQDDYFLEKRNKPSLSIVNPLDVLRQRLLLEIARRQMKENTRQVELNRAILKNVGKRMPDWRHYPQQKLPLQQQLQQQWILEQMQQQQQEQQQQQQQQHFPMHFDDYLPITSIFDFLQAQRSHQNSRGDINNIEQTFDDIAATQALLDDAKKSLDIDETKGKYQINGNEIENEIRNHLDAETEAAETDARDVHIDVDGNGDVGGNGGNDNYAHGRPRSISMAALTGATVAASSSGATGNDSGKHGNRVMGYNGGNGNGNTADVDLLNNTSNNGNVGVADNSDSNAAAGAAAATTSGGGGSRGYQLRYLYNLHRNHFARK